MNSISIYNLRRARIPLIVIPRLISLIHRTASSFKQSSSTARNFIIGTFAIAVASGIYFFMLWTLTKVEQLRGLVYFSPQLTLGLILVFLFSLLIFSNLVEAFGVFLLASDLELIVSKPVAKFRFFWGRLLIAFWSSSWMVIIFIAPVILSFCNYYHKSPIFLFVATLSLVPYFIIPTAISVIIALLLSIAVPARHARIFFKTLFLLLIALFVALIVYINNQIPDTSAGNFEKITFVVSKLISVNQPWLPSNWAANIIADEVQTSREQFSPYLALSYCLAFCLIGTAYLVFRFSYRKALSTVLSGFNQNRIRQKVKSASLFPVSGHRLSKLQAFMLKELRTNSRDFGQIIQFLMLILFCLFFFFNFRIFSTVDISLPNITKEMWQNLIAVSAACMEAFLITAIGTRFIFPSVSMEGQGFWLLNSSPLSVRQFLKLKFYSWLIPITCFGTIIFLLGALGMKLPFILLVFNVTSGVIVSGGVVAIAIGLGAYFANFDWEHPSQLAASFGSMVYMLSSVMVVSLCLIPTWLLAIRLNASSLEHDFKKTLGLFACLIIIAAINYYVGSFALKLGEAELKRKL